MTFCVFYPLLPPLWYSFLPCMHTSFSPSHGARVRGAAPWRSTLISEQGAEVGLQGSSRNTIPGWADSHLTNHTHDPWAMISATFEQHFIYLQKYLWITSKKFLTFSRYHFPPHWQASSVMRYWSGMLARWGDGEHIFFSESNETKMG